MELKLKLKCKRNHASQIELDNDWRDIKGFPHYQINRAGQIKRLDAIITDSNGIDFFRKGKIISNRKHKNGYIQTTLTENGIQYTKFIHVLLAEAFIPNPNNLYLVNHKDENPSNNSLDNLEWCDYSYNANYSIEKIRKAHEKEQKAVIRIDRITKEEKEYKGLREAARDNKVHHSSIRRVILSGGYCGGYKWKYK